MKIEYEKVKSENLIRLKCIFKFKIVNSILKSHYKELARISTFFNRDEKNVGYIKQRDEKTFLDLVAKIEKSSDKRCKTSHKKSVEKCKNKNKEICEHADLGSLGYKHGETVKCPYCGKSCKVW